MSKAYHVSFVYDNYMGIETFEEITVEAEDEEEALEFAEHDPRAPEEYKDVEVQEF